jgi:dipeptidyl-peptidase-4
MKLGSRGADIPGNVLYREQNTTYIDVNDNLIFLQDGRSFLWNSESDGYNHIWQFYMDGTNPRQITKGNWDVISFYGLDEKSNTLFYTSSEASAMEEHVYSIDLKKLSTRKLSLKPGVNTAVFSKTFAYYINYHSSANTPPFISMHNQSGKLVRILKDNSALNSTLEKYKLSQKEFFTFTNAENIALNCWMIKPANFDERQKYPVFVSVYGGPGHNTVRDSWSGKSYLWHQMLAQQGFIVVSCDPRGTQYRGKDFKHSTYKQLGKHETQDFIDLAKHLSSMSYVDGKRIGIQGWSYGGYMSSLCMTKGAEYFKAGIAVAPVTNWRYYDSIYTERFMQTPQENASGYDDNSPINHVEKLKGKYLLIHGSADDNVHYQNTMEMVEALVQANKQFDLFIYPNKNHGIYGGNTTLHLYTMMTDFILKNL